MDTIKRPNLKQNQSLKENKNKGKKTKIITQKPRKTKKKNQFKFLSTIRTKAAILAVLIGIVPLVLVSVGGIYLSKESLQQQILESEQILAEDLQEKINLFMKERFGDIGVLANLDVFTNSKIRDNLTPQEKANILTEYQEQYGVYDNIALFDIKGDVIAQSSGEPLKNHLNRTYIQETLKTKKPVLSQPIISTSSGVFSVYTASIIKDKNSSEIIGFIRTRIPVKNIESLLNQSKDQNKQYYLINKNQEVFIGPEGTYITKILSSGSSAKNNQEQYQAVNFSEIFPDLKSAIKEQKIVTKETFNLQTNTQQLAAFIPPQDTDKLLNLQWSTIVSENVDSAFASQKELSILLINGIILTIIVIVVSSFYLANKVTKPILEAAITVAEIGAGKLDTRLTLSSKDELGLLATNINLMVNQLETFVNSQTLSLEKTKLLAEINSIKADNVASFQDILDEYLTKIRAVLKVDRIVVYRFNNDFSGYICSESVGKGWTPAKNQEIGDECIPVELLEQYKLNRIVPTEDVFRAGFHPEHLDLMKRLQIKANLVVGIAEAGELYGLLVAHQCSKTYQWQESDISFMQDLARELSLVYTRFSDLEKIKKAQQKAENLAQEQANLKQQLQKRALELLIQVDPVSRGDLTIRATVTPDEIGTVADSYNATIENLRKVVSQVQIAAQVVTDTTMDNEGFVQELSAQIQRQVEEMNNTLMTIDAMGQSINLVAKNAKQAEEAVQEAADTVARGDEAMNRTVDGILALRTTVAETAKKVKRLGEASQKISKVVNLIDGFTDQTNLLALNASIEAANAGEEGRGFAVVAEEVRNLAKQSAEATADIASLVEEIQADTNEVVAAMETGTEQVVTGTKLVEEARDSLNQIQKVSAKINDLVKAIALATVEQSNNSEIASQTINEIASMTQNTSLSVANVSHSFQELLALAKELQSSVGKFKVH